VGKYLFSTHGRVNRGRFWLLTLLALGVVLANGVAIVLFERYANGQIGIPTRFDLPLITVTGFFLPIYIILLCAGVTFAIRRLHDRGKSGIWLLVMVFAPFVLFAVDDSSTTSNLLFSLALDILGFTVWAWGLVEIGVLPGTDGNNIYGGNPRGAKDLSR